MKLQQNSSEFGPLFSSDQDRHCNTCLNWTHDALELYTLGYKEAADSLVSKIVVGGRYQDILVFPICFLYRQYIELRLKEIIRSGRRLLDEPSDFPKHHKIKYLWDLVGKILNKVFADDSEPPDLSLAAHVVAEFSKLDPDSFAFRYPIDKSGENSLQGISHINLRRVADFVGSFSKSMEGASTAISVYLENKMEMLAEFRE